MWQLPWFTSSRGRKNYFSREGVLSEGFLRAYREAEVTNPHVIGGI